MFDRYIDPSLIRITWAPGKGGEFAKVTIKVLYFPFIEVHRAIKVTTTLSLWNGDHILSSIKSKRIESSKYKE